MSDPLQPKRRNLSDYFFSYSWSELGAVRALRNTWVMFYMCFAAIGLIVDPLDHSTLSAFCAGAIANYPGYLLGIWNQRREQPDALIQAELMVWQLGNVAKIFFVAGALFLAKELLRG